MTCEELSHLPVLTKQTVDTSLNPSFAAVKQAIVYAVGRHGISINQTEQRGSHSWSVLPELRLRFFGEANDLMLFKLCNYGIDDCVFGVREQTVCRAEELRQYTGWDRRFQVPPNYGEEQFFVGFRVTSEPKDLSKVDEVIAMVIRSTKER